MADKDLQQSEALAVTDKTRYVDLGGNVYAQLQAYIGASKVVKVSGASVGANTTQYSSGDLLGNLLTLTDAVRVTNGKALLVTITIHDLTNQKSALDVVIFDSNPSLTTFTNNSALDVADGDLPKVCGYVTVAASDYISFADNAIATIQPVAIECQADSSDNLYACLVCRGTPTYAANELSITFGFLQD